MSIPNNRLEPASDPVVLFKETSAGMPRAVRAWFYPSESIGYEFVYPHDQALKIAQATHESVLASTGESSKSSSEGEQLSALRGQKIDRVLPFRRRAGLKACAT